MADKCKWKDGKFEPCEGMDDISLVQRKDGTNYIDIANQYSIEIDFCPFCGADIRKLEEKTDKIYLLINGEKFVIDFDDTAEKVEKNIAGIITRETGMLAKVELREARDGS